MHRTIFGGIGAFTLTLAVAACSALGQAAPIATNTPVPSGRFGSNGGPNVFGTVQSINGSTLTIQGPRNGGSITVTLNSGTSIRKQVEKTIGDVKSGESIVAFGQEDGGVLQARQIQLGTAAAATLPPGGAGGAGRAGNGDGGRAGNGGTRAAGAAVVSGTVDGVSGDTISVKKADGTSAQVQLATNGRILEQTSASPSDIKRGDLVIVNGSRQGDSVTATSIDITSGRPGGGNAASGSGG